MRIYPHEANRLVCIEDVFILSDPPFATPPNCECKGLKNQTFLWADAQRSIEHAKDMCNYLRVWDLNFMLRRTYEVGDEIVIG